MDILGVLLASKDVWVVAEYTAAGLRECTLEALDEGRRLADGLGGRLAVILLGNELSSQVIEAGRWDVDLIFRVEHPLLSPWAAEAWTAALADMWHANDLSLVLFSATPLSQDIAPRLAARLRVGCYLDCVQIRLANQGELRFIRPTYQEKVYTTYTCSPAGQYIASLRPGVIGVDPPKNPRVPQVIAVTPDLEAANLLIQTGEYLPGDPKSVDLTVAEKIVSGGKGVGNPQSWQVIEDLADALEAAVGGSRAALDQGCITRERMVGQTGKSVRPRLYLAVGISGVYHHLAAVEAENVIAINLDRTAPIFARAGLGVVGDLHTILPMLTRRLQERRNKGRAAEPGGTGENR